jgi:hypothetical protein
VSLERRGSALAVMPLYRQWISRVADTVDDIKTALEMESSQIVQHLSDIRGAVVTGTDQIAREVRDVDAAVSQLAANMDSDDRDDLGP